MDVSTYKKFNLRNRLPQKLRVSINNSCWGEDLPQTPQIWQLRMRIFFDSILYSMFLRVSFLCEMKMQAILKHKFLFDFNLGFKPTNYQINNKYWNIYNIFIINIHTRAAGLEYAAARIVSVKGITLFQVTLAHSFANTINRFSTCSLCCTRPTC